VPTGSVRLGRQASEGAHQFALLNPTLSPIMVVGPMARTCPVLALLSQEASEYVNGEPLTRTATQPPPEQVALGSTSAPSFAPKMRVAIIAAALCALRNGHRGRPCAPPPV
jgi:hypothetical protein